MSQELSPKMKQIVSGDNPSSVYPIILLLKDVSPDNQSSWKTRQKEDFLLFSTKQVVLDTDYYTYVDQFHTIPLLKGFPKITNKADIIDNKYTISTLTFNILNTPFKGKNFVDNIKDFTNAACIVYFSANGITNIDDCYQVFTGTARRFTQNEDVLRIITEDITQQKMQSLVPSVMQNKEEMIIQDESDVTAKPYPMVYGKSFKHKLSLYSESGSTEHNVAKLVIDRPGKEIEGAWIGASNMADYGNEHIDENHDLVTAGYLLDTAYLSHGKEGKYSYISQELLREFSYNFESFPSDGKLFTYCPSTSLEGAHIKLGHATIELEDEDGRPYLSQVLPNRIYNPIKRVGFLCHNDNNQDWEFEGSDKSDSYNYFVGYKNASQFHAKGWKYHGDDYSFASLWYNSLFGDINENILTWAPTEANYPIYENKWRGPEDGNSGVTYNGWGRAGFGEDNSEFDVNWIQDGSISSGIYMFGWNSDGEKSSGNSYIKLEFETEISQECTTQIYADWIAHSPYNTAEDGDQARGCYWSGQFWFSANNGAGNFDPWENLVPDDTIQVHYWDPRIEWTHKIETVCAKLNDERLVGLQTLSSSNYRIPNGYGNYNPEGNEQTVMNNGFITGLIDSEHWNNTTTYNNMKIGMPLVDKEYGWFPADDIAIVMFQLANIYIFHDTYLGNLSEVEYFADISGRVGSLQQQIEDIEITDTRWIMSIYEIMEVLVTGTFMNEEIANFLPHDYLPDQNGQYPNLWVNKIMINCYKEGVNNYNEFLGDTGGVGTEIYIESPLDNFTGIYTIIGRGDNIDQSDDGVFWEVAYIVTAGKLNWNLSMLGDTTVSTFSDVTIIGEEIGLVEKPHRIMQDILATELNFGDNYDYNSIIKCDDITEGWIYGFSIYRQIPAKELIEGIARESNVIPTFRNNGKLHYLPIYDEIGSDVDIRIINGRSVKKYAFEYTKIEDVSNIVNVKYRYDDSLGGFTKETGYQIEAENNIVVDNLDQLTTYTNDADNLYDIGYYNMSLEDGKSEFEAKYINNEDVAKKLQKRLILWNCNQHLIVKFDLPMSYLDLQVGEYIRFDRLLADKTAFGFDYTKHIVKNGQLIYPFFFVTKIEKDLKGVKVEAFQMHRGQYGFPEGWENFDDLEYGQDTGETILPDGSETDNWNQPDPGDDPNWGDNSIITDDEEIEDEQIQTFNFHWIKRRGTIITNKNRFIEGKVTTNWAPSFSFAIYITKITHDFNITNSEGEVIEFNAGEYTLGQLRGEVLLNTSINFDNYFKQNILGTLQSDIPTNLSELGGSISISKKYDLPVSSSVSFFLLITPENEAPLPALTHDPYFPDHHIRREDPFTNPDSEDEDETHDPLPEEGNTISATFKQAGATLQSQHELIEAFKDSTHMSEFELGDVNQDGILNIQDIIIMIAAIMDNNTDELENADMDGDGNINVLDCVQLMNKILD